MAGSTRYAPTTPQPVHGKANHMTSTDHQPLTDQQLDDIDARQKAATPGPWGVYQYGGDSLIEIAADLEDTGCGYQARRTVCRFDEEPLDNDPTHREWTADEYWAQVQADARFIAHAPEDVDALVAEVRRLRAVLPAIVDALQARAGELQELAEEQMRPSLEERAQEWLEAAEVARRAAAVPAVVETGE